MIRFLRLIVEKSLSADPTAVKEYTLGLEVFDRPADFDPKNDTIVRVEARRLRRKLDEYYAGPGANDALRIDMPSPGYAPVFLPQAVPVTSSLPSYTRASRWLFALAIPLLAAVWWFTRTPPSSLTSVAVLPFANLSGDPSQDYFSDGFTEELIDRLSSLPNLRVAARTSSFQFKGRSLDVRDIAKRLNVDAVVEGSLRRSGGTVRITAQLIRASDGYHVWSRTWNRTGQDVLQIETDVASAIAESYRLTLTPNPHPAPSLQAHDLYLVGRSHWHTLEPAELFQAIDYFQQAIALSPDYALAHSGLSEAYSYLIDMDVAPTRDLAPKARAAAVRALALDPSLAEAHTSLGLVQMDADWNFPGAAASFAKAIALKPRFAYGVHWQAHYLENIGDTVQGCAEMERAMKIDPLDRVYQVDLAMCRYQQRRYSEALAQLGRAREIDPQWPLFDLTETLLALGRRNSPDALSAAHRTQATLGPVPITFVILTQAEALAGHPAQARHYLSQLEAASRNGYVPAYARALTHYAAGDFRNGYHHLRRAWDDRNGALVWLGRTALFDAARQDPAAAQLLAHVGDAAYQPQ
ncbi:MAG: hypothetical protein K2X03_18475 [Bryobacteraceae bacterium]|nr:hypothetical protein [Bryobacteraceae bacterium]